jgi:diketogulonate reductase-like aldo/keto reductase
MVAAPEQGAGHTDPHAQFCDDAREMPPRSEKIFRARARSAVFYRGLFRNRNAAGRSGVAIALSVANAGTDEKGLGKAAHRVIGEPWGFDSSACVQLLLYDVAMPAVDGVRVPPFLYGTAWKKDDTERLVTSALAAGFTGIDTANQRKHYHEAGVGDALAAAFAAGVDRASLFLQTKFTHRAGQDHRLPYDERAPVETQVRQSFESSLQHLHVDVIDSLVMHGPSLSVGLAADDWAAWRAMEDLHEEKRVPLLGVSNVSAEQLALLCDKARVKPAMVQNRCYARRGWDRAVRAVCRSNGIVYQGFSLLTANAQEMKSRAIDRVVERTGKTRAQIVYRFAMHLGMICLDGTTDRTHMVEDLACTSFELTEDEIANIENVSE